MSGVGIRGARDRLGESGLSAEVKEVCKGEGQVCRCGWGNEGPFVPS